MKPALVAALAVVLVTVLAAAAFRPQPFAFYSEAPTRAHTVLGTVQLAAHGTAPTHQAVAMEAKTLHPTADAVIVHRRASLPDGRAATASAFAIAWD